MHFIETDRQTIIELPIDVEMLHSLRETAYLAVTHSSTQIKGNRLTQTQVEMTLVGARFPVVKSEFTGWKTCSD